MERLSLCAFIFFRPGQGQQASEDVSCHQSVHSIHLHKCFVLVRIVVDPESISGTLGMG